MNDLLAARLRSQLLAGPSARSPEEVVGRLLAVQAQDARGARLAVRARSSGLAATDVDQALTVRRSLVISWLNRGTLHLVAAEDYWWLHALTTPKLVVGNERRLRQEGVSAAQAGRGVAVIVEAVTSDGPQTRAQLRHRLDKAAVPTGGQALVQILFAASLQSHVVRGPIIGNEHGYVSAPAWLGRQPAAFDRGEALGILARRYLAGHGPAGAPDLAKWAGVTVGEARLGFGTIADELATVREGLYALTGRPEPDSSTAPRLLGAFDPLLHGWLSREAFVGRHGRVVTTNGIFRPVGLVAGRVVATWSLPDGVVSICPLERIRDSAVDALIADGAAVLRFLGLRDQPVVVE